MSRRDGGSPAEVPEKEYYSVAQAAEFLQVSPSTIWRWIQAHRLPAYRVGPKTIRIRKEDLHTMVQPSRPGESAAQPVREDADIWLGYDAESVTAGGREAAGSWADADAEALIAELYRAREAGSRPAERP